MVTCQCGSLAEVSWGYVGGLEEDVWHMRCLNGHTFVYITPKGMTPLEYETFVAGYGGA